MSIIQEFIDKLSQVDMEIINKPKKGAVNEFIDNFFGPSAHAKKRERERKRILRNKKIMIINSFPVPSEGNDLVAIGNLALSSFHTIENKNEKEAWRNKLTIILNKLRNTVISDPEAAIYDDYLYLTDEIEKVLNKKKWKFFGN